MYALYWDIVMDWGMMQNPQALVAQACTAGSLPLASVSGPTGLEGSPSRHMLRGHRCHHLFLRPRLRYGLTMSALIVLADTLLRFSWLLRFVSDQLFVSQDTFVLCTQFLEVFRRAIWNLLRMEWENIKQKSKQLKARDSLSDHEDGEAEIDIADGEQEMVNLVPLPTVAGSSTASSSNSSTANHQLTPSKKILAASSKSMGSVASTADSTTTTRITHVSPR